jgi:hypothetical protein
VAALNPQGRAEAGEDEMRPLQGKVAVVAGATRGKPVTQRRPETIEETAELVSAQGGTGIVAVQTDHTVEEQVEALFARVRREQGGLDVLVNDVWGGDELTEFGKPFWEVTLLTGRSRRP